MLNAASTVAGPSSRNPSHGGTSMKLKKAHVAKVWDMPSMESMDVHGYPRTRHFGQFFNRDSTNMCLEQELPMER